MAHFLIEFVKCSNFLFVAGLLDTLMLDDDPSASEEVLGAVLVPSSPSATSKAGEDHHVEINQALMPVKDLLTILRLLKLFLCIALQYLCLFQELLC